MSFFRTAWRFIRVVAMFLYAGLELAVTRPRTRPERAAWLSRFCARMLRANDVTYTARGPVPMSGAVISNHLTFLDILIHSAIRPCVFVSKAELRSTPLLGWMSMMSGTVYVSRGAGGSAAAAAEVMAKGFRDGLPIVFFPEGTTGVGDPPLLPFRTGLIAKTLEAGATVTPGFIRYELSPKDLAAGKTLRRDLHWGDCSLFTQSWNFLSLHGVHATIQFAAAPMVFSPAALSDRKRAGVEAQAAVLALHAASTASTV